MTLFFSKLSYLTRKKPENRLGYNLKVFIRKKITNFHFKVKIGKSVCVRTFLRVLLSWRSGLVRSTSAVGGGEWLWVQSMVVGTPCRGP